jgi:hypothetical protein
MKTDLQPEWSVAFEPRLNGSRPKISEDGRFESVPGLSWADDLATFTSTERTFWYADAFQAVAGPTNIADHCQSMMNKQRRKACLGENESEQSKKKRKLKDGRNSDQPEVTYCDMLIVHIFGPEVVLDQKKTNGFLDRPYVSWVGRIDLMGCERPFKDSSPTLIHQVLDRVFVRFRQPARACCPFGTALPELGVIEIVFVETKMKE